MYSNSLPMQMFPLIHFGSYMNYIHPNKGWSLPKRYWIPSFQRHGKKNDAPDELKAIYLTYVQISSKEGGTEGIKYLKGELAKSGQRARPLLHYVTALSYYDYYRQNQWEINSRTAFVSTDEEIESWGQEQFVKTIHDHLFASVDTSLQTEPINEWKTVLEEIDSNLAVYRPVLYDVIIPEVTEILSQGELQLLYLDEQKWLKDPAFFADREGFYGIQIKDTLSLLDDAISLYQNWLKWREGNDDKGPLAHADLSRLKYFYAHSNHPDKDDLYLQALERFMDTYEDTMAVAKAMYEQAQIYHQKRTRADKSLHKCLAKVGANSKRTTIPVSR